MSEGLKQSYFRKKLIGLQIIKADQITGTSINIPDGTLNTSNVKCNTMNVCYIEYPGGICTNVSANLALFNQNVSIVPFVNSSLVSYNTSVVSALTSYNTSLCTFINSSLVSYNTSVVSALSSYNTSLKTFINSSLVSYNTSVVSALTSYNTSLCTFVNSKRR